jgi:hypothetical protein
MNKNEVSLEEWRKLYEAMIRLKKIAPWERIEETDIFGVQNPGTGEIGYVSIMGLLGEHYGISVYTGDAGLSGFWKLQYENIQASPEQLLECPQLQASFEDRDMLEKKDAAIIKKLNLKFRGESAYPFFRSIRPGCLPWFLEPEEACFLGYVLEQTLDVVLRFEKDPSLLKSLKKKNYLVRVPRQENKNLSWEDRIIRIEPSNTLEIPVKMKNQEIKALDSRRRSDNIFEIDFFIFPIPIHEKNNRPYLPYILLVVDSESQYVFCHDLLPPIPSWEEMWGSVPGKIVSLLGKMECLPKEIRVRSELLCQLLQPLSEELDIKLKQSRKLKSLDSAKKFLHQVSRQI